MSASVANLWTHEDCTDCLAVRVLPDNNDTVISTTLSGETSNEHRSLQSRSQSAWCGRTINALMALLCSCGPKANRWHGTSLFHTRMQSLILPTRLALQGGSWPGSTTENLKVCRPSQHTHLLSHSHRDDGDMEWHGYRVSTGDWATHHCHHRRLQGNHIFVPTLVDSSSTGNAVSFQNTITTEWAAVIALS